MKRTQLPDLGTLALVGLIFLRCGSSNVTIPKLDGCPGTMKDLDPSCCANNDGVQTNFDPPKCSSKTPDEPGVSGSLAAGSAAAYTTGTSLDAARSLVGLKKGSVETGGVTLAALQQSAASAGDGSNTFDIKSKGDGGDPKKGNELEKKRHGAPGAGNTGGGAGLDVTQGLSTDSAAGHQAAAGAGGTDGAGDPKFSGGGGGGGGAEGSSRGGGMVSGGAGQGNLAFGNGADAGAEAGGPSAMLAQDPEDYFTRMELGDDIFKRVERQYRAQARHMAAAPQVAPAAPVKKAR